MESLKNEDNIIELLDDDDSEVNSVISLGVEEKFIGTRIDKALTEMLSDYTRNYFQRLIDENSILVNNQPVKSNYKLKNDDNIEIHIPEPKELEVLPENIPLDIIYEDDDVLIVNKPKGMVVHPANGHPNGTLVNAIMYHCKDRLSEINGTIRPGIVHRIDMNTTGSLIICKNDVSHNDIAEQIAVHSINRIYVGIVKGILNEDEGTIKTNIGRSKIDRKKMAVLQEGGKEAITHFKVLERLNNATYVQFKLETGRTHQIRVHMAYLGHPLLGDDVYGHIGKNPYKLQGQTLHAKSIGFIHPTTKQYVEFEAPIPEYFEKLLVKLRK